MTHRMHGPIIGPSYNVGLKGRGLPVKILPTVEERERNRVWQANDRSKHPDRHMAAKHRNWEWRAARRARQVKRKRRIR